MHHLIALHFINSRLFDATWSFISPLVKNVLICSGKLYNIRVQKIVFGKANISILSMTLSILVEGNKTSLDTITKMARLWLFLVILVSSCQFLRVIRGSFKVCIPNTSSFGYHFSFIFTARGIEDWNRKSKVAWLRLRMIFVCFICFLSVLQTMETTATTQKQNRLDSTMPSCNINNYNSFYAGHNKKLENMIIEMKRKLDAIEQELKNLTKKVEPTKIGKLHGLLVSWISDLI